MSHNNFVAGGLFGVETTLEDSAIAIIPVPWDATTSYGGGTAKGPEAIFQASPQIDLFDIELGNSYEVGYHLLPPSKKIVDLAEPTRALAKQIIDSWDEFGVPATSQTGNIDKVNFNCNAMVNDVFEISKALLSKEKLVGLIGGDHSTPLGLIKALGEKFEGDFGILHIDAHADLRNAYQGFKHSHASIMYNVMQLEKAPAQLTQVGIRDFCEEEWDYVKANKSKIQCFYDQQLKSALFDGASWNELCEDIVESLPNNVYISFDIDGLSPEFCPGTGTPVPGGLSFDQVVHLLSVLGQSGKVIIGFDLNEVAPTPDSEWDGNVGARLLYKLCGWLAETNS